MAKNQEVGNTTKIKVKVIAIKKLYKEKPFFATIVYDPKVSEYLNGQESLTLQEKEEAKKVITFDKNSSYVVRHNDELNLEKFDNGKYKITKDYLLYLFYLTFPEIASSFKEKNANSLFYLLNEQQVAEDEVKSDILMGNAYAEISKKSTLNELVNALFYFGERASNYTLARAQQYMYNKAKTEPKKVLEYYKNEEISNKIVFVKKLLVYSIITKNPGNGYYYYNDIILGSGDSESATFIYEEKNSKVYQALLKELEDKSGLKN